MCVGAVSFQMVDYMTAGWGEYLSQPCPGTIDAQLVSCPGLAGVNMPGTCPLVCPPSPEVCPDGLLLATSGLSSLAPMEPCEVQQRKLASLGAHKTTMFGFSTLK